MPTFRFNRVFPVIPERDHPFNNVRNIFQKNYIISNSIIPNISNRGLEILILRKISLKN